MDFDESEMETQLFVMFLLSKPNRYDLRGQREVPLVTHKPRGLRPICARGMLSQASDHPLHSQKRCTCLHPDRVAAYCVPCQASALSKNDLDISQSPIGRLPVDQSSLVGSYISTCML